MKRADLIKALSRLSGCMPGTEACYGCGLEHSCWALGCAIIRAAVEELKPPAEQRAPSRWQISCDGWFPFCPDCGAEPPGRELTPFCPICGADMREA